MRNFTNENASVSVDSINIYSDDTAIPEWCQIVLIIYMLVTAVLAICGNGIIILVERKNRCKTSTDWLVSCMAANDFIFALVSIPIHTLVHLGTWESLGSDGACKVHVYVEKVTTYSSTLLLCIVALDRYWKTCRPHSKFLTQQRAFRVCISITLLSCVVSSPLLVIVVFEEPSSCNHVKLLRGALVTSLTGVILITFIAVFIIIGVCYTKVALTIRSKLITTDAQKELSNTRSKSDNFSNSQVNTGVYSLSATPKTERPNSRQISENPGNNRQTSTDNGNDRQTSFGSNNLYSVNLQATGLIRSTPTEKSRGVRSLRNCKVAPIDVKGQPASYKQSYHNAIDSNHEMLFDQSNSSAYTAEESKSADKGGNSHALGSRMQQASKRLKLNDSRVDRTTKIMFAVTVVFLLSWLPTWIVMFYTQLSKGQNLSATGNIIVFFCRKAFMVNSFTNPIFYILLSSAFKERAKRVLRDLFICQRSRR